MEGSHDLPELEIGVSSVEQDFPIKTSPKIPDHKQERDFPTISKMGDKQRSCEGNQPANELPDMELMDGDNARHSGDKSDFARLNNNNHISI